MWLLIKLNSLNDIGQNEAERILIHESDISLKKTVSSVEISAYGVSVHPNTLDIGKITPQMMREYLLKCGWVAKPFGREEVLKFGIDKKLASYWVVIELTRVLNWNKKSLEEVEIKAEHFAELLKLVQEEKITETAAKQLLNEFIPKSFSPKEKIENIEKISDEEAIEEICREAIKKNAKAVEDYRKGEEKALHFMIGQVMAATKGRADNRIVREIILKLIS